MFNLPAISGDWSIEKMSNIKKNQALLWYSNGESELSLLDSLALGFYSDAEFFTLPLGVLIFWNQQKNPSCFIETKIVIR